MRKTMIAIVILLSLTLAAPARSNPSRHPSSRSHTRAGHAPGLIVAFESMYGVDGPFLGDAFSIRGVEGDELPWKLRQASGTLDTAGHLTIQVRGLVFTDDDEVPPELRNRNDEAEFRGLVSCLSEEGDQVVTRNVVTNGFHATPSGNALIRATLELPNPCVAPIVMVLAGSEDKWFAVTGFEAEGD